MPVHIREVEGPYWNCKFYNDDSQYCCGREHDENIVGSQGILEETIQLKNPDGTESIVGKYQLEAPTFMVDSWVSRFKRSPQLEAYLRQTRRLMVSIRRHTGSKYVSTPIQRDCPIAARLNRLASPIE